MPAISGCVTQAETWDELIKNIYEAVEGCLSVDVEDTQLSKQDKVLEVIV